MINVFSSLEIQNVQETEETASNHGRPFFFKTIRMADNGIFYTEKKKLTVPVKWKIANI
jgi:hypothetical protein